MKRTTVLALVGCFLSFHLFAGELNVGVETWNIPIDSRLSFISTAAYTASVGDDYEGLIASFAVRGGTISRLSEVNPLFGVDFGASSPRVRVDASGDWSKDLAGGGIGLATNLLGTESSFLHVAGTASWRSLGVGTSRQLWEAYQLGPVGLQWIGDESSHAVKIGYVMTYTGITAKTDKVALARDFRYAGIGAEWTLQPEAPAPTLRISGSAAYGWHDQERVVSTGWKFGSQVSLGYTW